MIQSGTWNKEGTVLLLRKTLYGLAAGWIVVVGWLSVSASMLSTQATTSLQAAKGHEANLADLRATIKRANSEQSEVPPTGFGSVAAFQASVENSAASRGCAVTEFQAGAEIMPFLTRFKKDTPKNEWGQVEVQFSVRGRLVDVVNTVRSFSDQTIPFEFNSVEIARQDVDRVGTATVSAKVSLRVLTRFQGDTKV